MVSAAGLAPAIPRFQAEHVAPTPRAGNPEITHTSVRGHGEHGALNPGTVRRGEIRKLADPKGLAPSTLPQTTGRSTLSYGSSEMVGSAGNAPVVASGFLSDTAVTVRQPDHFPGKVAGVGVAPTEVKFMRLD